MSTYGSEPQQNAPQQDVSDGRGGVQGPASYPAGPGSNMQQPYGYAAPRENPGQTFGIVGLVLGFFPILSIAGLVFSILGLRRSKRVGMSNVPAVIGIILSALNILATVIVGALLIAGVAMLINTCQDLGPGTHYVDGVTYTCS